MISIPPLKKNDLIYITAPAKAIEEEHVIYAKQFFEKEGYRVEVSKNCLGQHNYFSGTDDERTADLQYAFDNPEIKAIVCARGGYGSIRILDKLQWASMIRDPKWLLGFSDITIFHQRLFRFELPSIHGTMPLNFKTNSPEALETLMACLTGKSYSIQCDYDPSNKLGQVKGQLIGGNFSILYSLLGTDDQIDYSGKILFIEDLAEHLYHLDRILYAFQKSGILNKISGLIVGGMTNMQDTSIPFGSTFEEIILDHLKYRNIPVAFGFPLGHIPDNRAVIVGGEYSLSVSNNETSLTLIIK